MWMDIIHAYNLFFNGLFHWGLWGIPCTNNNSPFRWVRASQDSPHGNDDVFTNSCNIAVGNKSGVCVVHDEALIN